MTLHLGICDIGGRFSQNRTLTHKILIKFCISPFFAGGKVIKFKPVYTKKKDGRKHEKTTD